MVQRKMVPGEDLVIDVRGGMSNSELMAKYGLAPGDLKDALVKLQKVKALDTSDVGDRLKQLEQVGADSERRAVPRFYLRFPLTVYDANTEEVAGSLRNISEKGLQLSGTTSGIGEVRDFLIRAEGLEEVGDFTLRAKCMWDSAEVVPGELVAGFAISEISQPDRQELRKLIDFLDFESG